MNTPAATAAHRRCALLLAPLHGRDQRALLAALPAEDVPLVRALLDELRALKLPLDALPAQVVDASTPVLLDQPATAPVLDWNALAERSSPAWVARALAGVHGAEREFCLAALDAAHRDAVAAQLQRAPALPPALAESLRRHLLTEAEGH